MLNVDIKSRGKQKNLKTTVEGFLGVKVGRIYLKFRLL